MDNNNRQTNRPIWLGLDSYKEVHSDIFYGRNEEIGQLSSAIFHNTLTVIYGPSGTGKTSILRAGIFKIAREKRYLPVYIRLSYDKNGDGKIDILQQIISAIENEAKCSNIDIEHNIAYIEKTATGEDRCKSLWEYFHCNEFWDAENYPITPLIVMDQFEEIFTLGKDENVQDDFFVQLSDLCDNKYPQYIYEYLNERNNKNIDYPEKENFRCVISIREDFLARLEEKADDIPSLKRNRFSLQCVNEEQALDIIMKPCPNIVSEEVAIQIIEKVTNKKFGVDFHVHDRAEIVVEPSILSLFCSELDKKRIASEEDTITKKIVDDFGNNILRDFYVETLYKNLTGDVDSKIEFIEKKLLTGDGYRDSMSLKDALNNGFTNEEIAKLSKNRLIRKEKRNGTNRIEFTHDVLCKVAMDYSMERKQEKEKEELQRQQEAERLRLKRNANLIRIGFCIVMIFVIGVCGSYIYKTKKDKDKAIAAKEFSENSQRRVFNIQLYEDSTLLASEDTWTANMKIVGKRPGRGDTVVYHNNLTKDSCWTPIPCTMDSISKVEISIIFADEKKILPIETEAEASELKNNPTIKIEIKARQPISYEGCVKANDVGIQGAIVILNGIAQKTDHYGKYNFSFTDSLPSTAQNNIVIVKKGYKLVDTPVVFDKDNKIQDLYIKPTYEVEYIEAKYDTLRLKLQRNKNEAHIKTDGGVTYLGNKCDISGYIDRQASDSVCLDGAYLPIWGYYTYSSGNSRKDKYIITRCEKTSEQEDKKSFLIEGINYLYEKQTMTWTVESQKKTQGKISESGVIVGEIEQLRKE